MTKRLMLAWLLFAAICVVIVWQCSTTWPDAFLGFAGFLGYYTIGQWIAMLATKIFPWHE